MAVSFFFCAMFLLWRNHHRTVTVTRELADSAVILAEELNLLIGGAQDYAIYMLDPDWNVTIWNEGAQRLKGWTAAEMVGKPADLFYPDDAVAAGKPATIRAEAVTRGKIEMDDWRVRKDGSEFLAHIAITALKNLDNGPRLCHRRPRHYRPARGRKRSAQQRVASSLHPVDCSRCDDRHRRTGKNVVLQRCGRAPLRLHAGRSPGSQCQHAHALALSRAP